MRVIVDTSVWSIALRHQRPNSPLADALAMLLRSDSAVLLGVVRLELLSGISDRERFAALRDQLRQIPDYALTTEHYEVAAESFTICRSKGIQGSHVDFLLCAVSQLDRLPIMTTDNDFEIYKQELPITFWP